MKTAIGGTLLLAVMFSTSGCAWIVNGGADDEPVPAGLIFTYVTWTDKSSPNLGDGSKSGQATAVAVLGLVGVGDASVRAACRSANIKTVRTIEHEFMTVLMLFNTYSTIVTGD